jgi:hypothetical protein
MMTAMILPIPSTPNSDKSAIENERVLVVVNIRTEVLKAEAARRKANQWLLENAGKHLGTTTPELVLEERLYWRYDVMLELPNTVQPGSGALYRIGQIVLDAITGEIQDADALAAELQAHVASIGR